MKDAMKSIKRLLVPRFRKDDFVEIDDNGFWAGRSHQTRSLRLTAKTFNQIRGEIIVEVGSGVHGPMAGNSIIVWATKTTARRILAVDLDPARIQEVRDHAGHFKAVEPILADGKEVIENLDASIDLLYLDFWSPDGDSSELPGMRRAESYLEIYNTARSKLSARAIILIDDTDHIDPWKQTYIVPAARKDGFRVLYVGRQTHLQRF